MAESGRENPPGTAIGRGSIRGNTFLIRIAHDYVIACSISKQVTESGHGVRIPSPRRSAEVRPSTGDRYYVTGANGTYHVINVGSGKTVLESQLSDSLPKEAEEGLGTASNPRLGDVSLCR